MTPDFCLVLVSELARLRLYGEEVIDEVLRFHLVCEVERCGSY